MRFLRSNTAVIVTVGPFYDKTDGVTIETALTITNERITLTADTDAGSAPTNILDNVTGATSGTANDLNYITGNDAGMMQLELAAADTNRVGRMFLSITDAANHVPVFHEFFVLPQAIYDWLTGVIVPLPANVTTWLGTAAATPTVAGVPEVDVTHFNGTAGTFASGRPEVNTSHVAGTAQTAGDIIGDTNDIQTRLPAALVSGRMDSSVGAMAANVLTAAATAADFGAEVADAIWDEDIVAAHGTADTAGRAIRTLDTISDRTNNSNLNSLLGVQDSAGVTITTKLDTIDDFLDTEIAAILGAVDTEIGAIISTLGTPAGVSVSADIAAVKTETASIQSDTNDIQTRLPAALVGGRMDSSAGAIAANVITAAATAADFGTEVADAVWAKALETGFSADRILRIVASAVAAKVSGGPGSPVFRNLQDTADVITGTADASGNRTAASYGA